MNEKAKKQNLQKKKNNMKKHLKLPYVFSTI